MIPYPHSNLISFIGFGKKSDYLIWRHVKGFFFGLHKSGEIRVWSLFSGKLLGVKEMESIQMGFGSQVESTKDISK